MKPQHESEKHDRDDHHLVVRIGTAISVLLFSNDNSFYFQSEVKNYVRVRRMGGKVRATA